jgi:hypothetical protein
MTFDPDGWTGVYGGDGTAGGHGGHGAAGGPSDGEMRAALEGLPPGHPSSPWNADGTRRPAPPRLQDLELPLPGTWADTFEDGPAPGAAAPAAPAHLAPGVAHISGQRRSAK